MDRNKVVIMLDNGHGQATLGKCSPLFSEEWKKKYKMDRFREYLYNREIVTRLISELSNKYGFEVFDVTPETHGDVPLSERVFRANFKHDEAKRRGKTSLLVSVHVNASGNGNWMSAQGWSVWTTKGVTKSDLFAECLADSAIEVLAPLKKKVRTDLSDGDKDYEADFTIIKKTNCPSVLTENFFMDNKDDVEFLLSEQGKRAIVDIHVRGILKYVEKM